MFGGRVVVMNMYEADLTLLHCYDSFGKQIAVYSQAVYCELKQFG